MSRCNREQRPAILGPSECLSSVYSKAGGQHLENRNPDHIVFRTESVEQIMSRSRHLRRLYGLLRSRNLRSFEVVDRALLEGVVVLARGCVQKEHGASILITPRRRRWLTIGFALGFLTALLMGVMVR